MKLDLSRLPLDVRGPWGLAGAGLLVASGALLVVGLTGGEDDPPAEEGSGVVLAELLRPDPEAEFPPRPNGSPASGVGPVWDNGPPPEDRPVIDPEPAPLPDEDEAPPSVPLVTAQQSGNDGVVPARAGMAEVTYIVRLRGAPEVDVITRNFRRDPAAAQAAWAELTARIPQLAEFELAGASFSGELRLVYRMSNATPAAVRAVQDRLLAIEGVSYADPDFVAHPGKEDMP